MPYGLLLALCLSLLGCDSDECDAHFGDIFVGAPTGTTDGICSGDSGAFKICAAGGGGHVPFSDSPNYWQEGRCPASHSACVPYDRGVGQELGHQCTDPFEGVPCAMSPLLPLDSPKVFAGEAYLPQLSDLDQDGDLDLVYLSNGSLQIVFQSSPMNFQDVQGFGRYGTKASWLRLGQLDGSGWLDAIVHHGGSNVSVVTELDSTFSVSRFSSYGDVLALLDVDGDGQAETLVNDDSELVIRRDFGTSPSEADVVLTDLGMKTWRAAYGASVGGDAREDLVVRSPTSSYLLVATDTGFELVWNGPGIIVDLDADGLADALQTPIVKMGVGGGTVIDEVEFETTGYPGSSWLGDVNGDGHQDLVQVSQHKLSAENAPNQRISIYLGDGTGHLAPGVVHDPPDKEKFTVIGLEDLDGDGRADLVVVDRSGVVKVAPGTCQP